MSSTQLDGDLEAVVDLVYEGVFSRGRTNDPQANHRLMEAIQDLVGSSKESWDVSMDCWHRVWDKYRPQLVDLGYVPGW